MQVYKPNNTSTTTSKVVWETSNSDFCILEEQLQRLLPCDCCDGSKAHDTHRYWSYRTTMLVRLIRAKARKQYRVHLFAV